MYKTLFILFIAITTVTFSQDIRLTAKTEGESFRIGNWIDVNVEGTLGTPVESITPMVKDSIGPFEVVKVEQNGSNPKWLIRLTSIDSGKIFLPPIPFGYKIKNDTAIHIAYTNSLLLTITGVAIDPQGEIKDIKPPMLAPWLIEDLLPYIIAIIVIVGLGIVYYIFWQRAKKRKDLLADIKIIIPPHREALMALRVLEEKKLWQQGLVKGYYSEVTEIVRRFFEKRWGIIALELTSYEILIQMKHIPEALMVWKEMESFFLIADLVKFAKYQPSPAEHEDEMQSAYNIVRAMVPKTPTVIEEQSQEVTADVR
jgi:hypothetical protein